MRASSARESSSSEESSSSSSSSAAAAAASAAAWTTIAATASTSPSSSSSSSSASSPLSYTYAAGVGVASHAAADGSCPPPPSVFSPRGGVSSAPATASPAAPPAAIALAVFTLLVSVSIRRSFSASTVRRYRNSFAWNPAILFSSASPLGVSGYAAAATDGSGEFLALSMSRRRAPSASA